MKIECGGVLVEIRDNSSNVVCISDSLNIKEGLRVCIYKDKIKLDIESPSNIIENVEFGTVLSYNSISKEDWLGAPCVEFLVEIKLDNGKNVKITHLDFRKKVVRVDTFRKRVRKMLSQIE